MSNEPKMQQFPGTSQPSLADIHLRNDAEGVARAVLHATAGDIHAQVQHLQGVTLACEPNAVRCSKSPETASECAMAKIAQSPTMKLTNQHNEVRVHTAGAEHWCRGSAGRPTGKQRTRRSLSGAVMTEASATRAQKGASREYNPAGSQCAASASVGCARSADDTCRVVRARIIVDLMHGDCSRRACATVDRACCPEDTAKQSSLSDWTFGLDKSESQECWLTCQGTHQRGKHQV